MDRNTILVGIAAIAIIITGVLIFAHSNSGFSLPAIFGKSDSQIGKDAVDYINNNQLSQTPASLVGVSEKEGLVDIKIKIGSQEYDSYATKDGKLFFPEGLDLTPKKAKASASNTNTPAASAAVVKTASPTLDAFVVSSCPFGLQMQRALAEAVKGAPALASNIVVRYIGSISNGQVSSMHDAAPGGQEAQENLRQICIRQEQPTKYWNYVSCYMKKASGTLPNGMPLGDSTGCQASTGVSTAQLNACVSDPSRGLAYAKKDFDLSAKYNASGSPTLILNGAQISETGFGGRSADGARAMVCSGFTNQPGFCKTKLNTAEAAVSFSATYASTSGGTPANTNCAPAQ